MPRAAPPKYSGSSYVQKGDAAPLPYRRRLTACAADCGTKRNGARGNARQNQTCSNHESFEARPRLAQSHRALDLVFAMLLCCWRDCTSDGEDAPVRVVHCLLRGARERKILGREAAPAYHLREPCLQLHPAAWPGLEHCNVREVAPSRMQSQHEQQSVSRTSWIVWSLANGVCCCRCIQASLPQPLLF